MGTTLQCGVNEFIIIVGLTYITERFGGGIIETIKKVGKINYITNKNNGKGSRIINDFLEQLVSKFAD